jgi:hypothetical protein
MYLTHPLGAIDPRVRTAGVDWDIAIMFAVNEYGTENSKNYNYFENTKNCYIGTYCSVLDN